MKEKYIILRSDERPVVRSVTRKAGVRATSRSKVVVEVEQTTRKKAAEVAGKKGVMAVCPVIPMKLIKPVKRSVQAGKKNTGNTWGIEAIDAHTSSFTGEGIVVAVLDTGINDSHPAFEDINFTKKNFTTDADHDEDGHGTHCAGTIVGRDVNKKRIGVARGVKDVLIGKVIAKDGSDSDLIVRGVNWAIENGAHVISMSLGIDFPGYVKELQGDGLPPEIATSRALEGYRANVLLFDKLAGLIRSMALGQYATPAILIAAAGNESLRHIDPTYEIAVGPPGVAEGFISVGALGQSRSGLVVADFSNTGPIISGPGVDIISADLKKGLASMDGTSMAAPHVAGVAALWAEKLDKARMLNTTNLTASLIGSASMTGLKKGIDPYAVGSGMVKAPQ